MTTTENSRADALTDARILEIAETVGVPDTATDDVLVKFVRACLAASTALQPAAAPIDDARECLMDVVSHHDNIAAGFAAQRLAAEEAQDTDTAAYWKREIDVAHRMKAQAERALAAAALIDDSGARRLSSQLRMVCDEQGCRFNACEEAADYLETLVATSAPSPADERAAFDVALTALAEYQRNWDTGLPAEYAQGERIQMECAVEAVREALEEARAAVLPDVENQTFEQWIESIPPLTWERWGRRESAHAAWLASAASLYKSFYPAPQPAQADARVGNKSEGK